MPEQIKTPEWEQDLAERQAGFQAGLKSLLGKYEMGMVGQARITEEGTVGAIVKIFSVRKDPTQKEADATPIEETPAPEAPSPLSE